MVEINLREILKEYVVATVAAFNLHLAINKLPEYFRKIGEERAKKQAEYQTQLFEKMMQSYNAREARARGNEAGEMQ